MFEQASRLKLRFFTDSGYLSYEDLWDLPLTSTVGNTNLNDMAKALRAEVKEEAEEDFVKPKTAANVELNLRFDIVKHIIGVRLAENEAKRDKEAAKQKRQQIMEVLAEKENEELRNKTPEELRQMLQE